VRTGCASPGRFGNRPERRARGKSRGGRASGRPHQAVGIAREAVGNETDQRRADRGPAHENHRARGDDLSAQRWRRDVLHHARHQRRAGDKRRAETDEQCIGLPDVDREWEQGHRHDRRGGDERYCPEHEGCAGDAPPVGREERRRRQAYGRPDHEEQPEPDADRAGVSLKGADQRDRQPVADRLHPE